MRDDVYRGAQRMRDATGKEHLYRGVTQGVPPDYPHPLERLVPNGGRRWHSEIRFEGRGMPLVKQLEKYEALVGRPAGEDEVGLAVSGDETKRWEHTQCWDSVTTRYPDQKYFYGQEPCEMESCPHPKPHKSAQWILRRREGFPLSEPRFIDIAHVLYPGGVAPVPVGAAIDEEDTTDLPDLPTATHAEPEQLDMLTYLEDL